MPPVAPGRGPAARTGRRLVPADQADPVGARRSPRRSTRACRIRPGRRGAEPPVCWHLASSSSPTPKDRRTRAPRRLPLRALAPPVRPAIAAGAAAAIPRTAPSARRSRAVKFQPAWCPRTRCPSAAHHRCRDAGPRRQRRPVVARSVPPQRPAQDWRRAPQQPYANYEPHRPVSDSRSAKSCTPTGAAIWRAWQRKGCGGQDLERLQLLVDPSSRPFYRIAAANASRSESDSK